VGYQELIKCIILALIDLVKLITILVNKTITFLTDLVFLRKIITNIIWWWQMLIIWLMVEWIITMIRNSLKYKWWTIITIISTKICLTINSIMIMSLKNYFRLMTIKILQWAKRVMQIYCANNISRWWEKMSIQEIDQWNKRWGIYNKFAVEETIH
jgi:hypothetical protein